MDWEEACNILGVKPTASPEEIKRRYRLKQHTLHPDKTQHLPEQLRKEAEEELKLVNQAYPFLTNPLNNPFTNPPKLKISPKHIRFKDVGIGQKKTTSFEIDSIGGAQISGLKESRALGFQ
jgi:curved DNA-binding protein CbpA